MSLPHAVLGVLEARPMTGYELVRFLESTARWVWSAPQSQIYPLLRRMEADGLVSGEEQVRGQRLRRTAYSVTAAGLAELDRWLVEPVGDQPTRDPLLLKGLFLDLAEPGAACALLEAQAVRLEEDVARWSVHRSRLLARDTPLLRARLEHRPPEQHERVAALKASVFTQLIDQARLRIAWCRDTADLLSEEHAR